MKEHHAAYTSKTTASKEKRQEGLKDITHLTESIKQNSKSKVES